MIGSICRLAAVPDHSVLSLGTTTSRLGGQGFQPVVLVNHDKLKAYPTFHFAAQTSAVHQESDLSWFLGGHLLKIDTHFLGCGSALAEKSGPTTASAPSQQAERSDCNRCDSMTNDEQLDHLSYRQMHDDDSRVAWHFAIEASHFRASQR